MRLRPAAHHARGNATAAAVRPLRARSGRDFANVLTATSNTFAGNAGIFDKVYFPRLAVPIADRISKLIAFAIQLVFFLAFIALAFIAWFAWRGTALNPIAAIVIHIEHLSTYDCRGLSGGGTLREDLNRWWAKARRRPDPLLKIGETDHGNRQGGQIWARRDSKLEVREGDAHLGVWGLIGRNGAGKRTLLKVLSRITAPTEGRIRIKGRVGGLLEVGAALHSKPPARRSFCHDVTWAMQLHSPRGSAVSNVRVQAGFNPADERLSDSE